MTFTRNGTQGWYVLRPPTHRVGVGEAVQVAMSAGIGMGKAMVWAIVWIPRIYYSYGCSITSRLDLY